MNIFLISIFLIIFISPLLVYLLLKRYSFKSKTGKLKNLLEQAINLEIDNISKTYTYSEGTTFITLPRISVTIKIPRSEWGTLEIIRNRNNLNEIEIFEYLEAVRLTVKERNEFNRTLINIL